VVHSGIPTNKEESPLISSTITDAIRIGQWVPGETAGLRKLMPLADFASDKCFKCFNSFMAFPRL
jgi:hypothetical protein